MKFSENWLREWVAPDVDSKVLAEQLTTAGLEVDSLERAAGEFDHVVVALIKEIRPHPDADKLRICQVDDGSKDLVQVVCGAANATAGMKVPFAQVGATLPSGLKIKKAKLRGIESFGMLCSEQELAMADSADGLMELPENAPLGSELADYLNLDDCVIELDLTPNRGDCLSILGVARDVAAINAIPISDPKITAVEAEIDDVFPVVLDAPADCPVYCGRVIRNVDINAITPLWMQEKLRRSGIRSLGPVVDVTNYVLLELGQPMHAFDLDKLNGAIHVRRANSGEKLTLLDGREIEAEEDVLLIADQDKPLAMAGIMGGQGSEVGDETSNIFLESAFFSPLSVVGRARRYGLHTDSSHRFERGVDPQQQVRAIERATDLLIEIAGGQAGPVINVNDEQHQPQPSVIKLRSSQVNRLLGIDLEDKEIEAYLISLDMSVTANAGEWTVTPPGYRFDLQLEADLIEEIARLYGYDRLPESRPLVTQCMVAKAENELGLDHFRDLLSLRGWQEAITYSFVDPAIQQMLAPERATVDLSNPISPEMSQMRTSHWTGLLQALQHNQHRQQADIRLFEVGLNFIGGESIADTHQEAWISGIAVGACWPEQWAAKTQAIDFYDVKADIEAMLGCTRTAGLFDFVAEQHPALHPGQTARIYRNGQKIGWLGVLHPEIEKKLSVNGPVVLFELNGSALIDAEGRRFDPISKYPSIRRDLAFVVDDAVTSGQILDAVDNLDIKAIIKSWLFDVYRGESVESGRKSAALGLILQDNSRTLTDEEVEEVVSKVVATLGDKLNATLRD